MCVNHINVFSLNREEKKTIATLVDEIFNGHSFVTEDIFKNNIFDNIIEKLPKRLIEVFSIYNNSNQYLALRIEGNPFTCSNLQFTPNKYKETDTAHYINKGEVLHWIYSKLLGLPYSLEHQQKGAICNRIIPIKSHENIYNHSGGSSNTFDFHTEDAFLENKPDYISLYCIRNYEKAYTNLSYVKKQQLKKSTLDLLLKEKFLMKPNHHYYHSISKTEKGLMSKVISLNNDSQYLNLCINFNMINYDEFSEENRNALLELKNIVDRNKIEIILNTGDAIYIKNSIALHSRTSYTPQYGNYSRWLCRIITTKRIESAL